MNSYKRWKFNAMEGRESQLKRRGHINKERERETGSKVMRSTLHAAIGRRVN